MRTAAAQLLADLAVRAADDDRFRRGRKYHRNRKVTDLEVVAGELRARVSGSRSEDYDVVVGVRLAAAHLIEELKELSAEVGPIAVVEHAVEHGVEVVPAGRDIAFTCNCPDWAEPCKHAVAALLSFADLVDDDPVQLLAWRSVPLLELPAPAATLPTAAPPAAPTAHVVVPFRARSAPPPTRPAAESPLDEPDSPAPAVAPTPLARGTTGQVKVAPPADADPFFTGAVPDSGPLLEGLPPLETLPDSLRGARLLADGVDAAPVLRHALGTIHDTLGRLT